MSRWELLRDSLKKGRDTSNVSSIHAFGGHQLLHKEKVLWRGYKMKLSADYEGCCSNLVQQVLDRFTTIDSCEVEVEVYVKGELCKNFEELLMTELESITQLSLISSTITQLDNNDFSLKMLFRNSSYQPIYSICGFYQYTLPSKRTIYTREIPEKRKIKATDILSDKLFGVDNTGNICTWPSEAILLFTLLQVDWIRQQLSGKRVLEIGGGQTALAGLGLAVEGACSSVVVTDGHPHCVINQGVCIQCCKSKESIEEAFDIQNLLLEWSNYSRYPEHSVDVIIGSDCLFFKDFHEALIGTLHHVIAQEGVIYLLQPSRGGSLEIFSSKAEEFFDIERHTEYLPELTTQRDVFIEAQEAHYNVDKHYPILLVLRPKLVRN